ncbi:glycoside hydrolase family protein [Flavobacterium nitrogenifigens]|uniref:Lysozyme n=1 Tax=Flavobacterium nitrogenifigens TaxID=1617283 RepID=A0A521FBX4_9FLAO|nr:glycoside hydrolase family protein [Flavobacterium nitrogenifigens]KAF2337993.1 peptidoglycan DD-metalloendopeptidase family protein [Flavobacterium nitrogenifigens]SMO93101.1 Phage-related lysozyme (muramidase), GH24 family [Flavobacterium nitrogenifigens]
MNKNTVHNFNILIKNSTPLESSEGLTKNFINEFAAVSKEINEQKDIVQVWQEQNASNNVMSNTLDSAGEGVFDNNAAIKTAPSFNNTSSASESNLFTASTINASIGGGAFDSTESTSMSSFGSTGNTLPVSEAENTVLSNAFSQIYESIDSKQMLIVPQMFQSNSNEPSVELIKAEIKKKLDQAIKENNPETIQYWARINKAFDDEKTTVADFVNKPNEMLFTEMYNALKQLTATSAEVQNFNWNVVREKMIKAIDANILKGSISKTAKNRWEAIKKLLGDDKTNVANLFERYDELFLLLKEVEGLEALPNSITITTKTKIYPNLSADRLYASIGKEDVYVFLKQVSETDFDGSGVNKGAVKIKNTNTASFIVGESLEFFVDEAFINEKVNPKENINWIVYKDKNTESIFKNEGTSFSYNFDTPGTYRIDAYGKNHTVKQSKKSSSATFIELKVVAQDIVITPPINAKTEFIRSFAEEKTFKVSLKNSSVKTLNPIKLYYQIETPLNGKTSKILEEQELDSTGIIKLAMPDLGTYKIKAFSKDQYGLFKEFKTSVIKNEVSSIGLVEKSSGSNVFLLGIVNRKLTLEAKTFKINPPTDDEKEDVRWMIYDSSGKPYLTSGTDLFINKKDSQRNYIHKWKEFTMTLPQKAGHYTVEAFSDRQKGDKSGAIFNLEMKQPEITEAYWSWSGGSKKTISGLLESNWINANIPHYNNQTVRIYFYLGSAKTNHYIDVKTNSKGEIFEEVKFDATFQKAIGLGRKKNAKIGFKLLGIQNSKPYPFKSPANYDANTTLSLTADKKVLDVYFTYDGNRVTPEDEVPFGKKGAIVTIVAKTQNMVGEEVTLTAHKVSEKPSFAGKATVNSEGVATISFLLKNLDKKLKLGSKINYYAGVDGYSTKHLVNKVLVMIVGEGKKSKKKPEIIFPLLEKPTNDTNLQWGKNYNWQDDDGHNQATFDSFRDHGRRKHAARDLYTEPKALVIAIANGEVLETRYFYAGTHQVTVLHKLKDGRKFIARYGELDPNSIEVKKGDQVKQGKVLGKTGKLLGKSVISGYDIYMLHFEIFSAEKEENINNPLTNKVNGSPFQRRKDLLDSIDILLEGYKNTFEADKGDRKDIKLLNISDKGKDFIKNWESYKRKMYDNDGDLNSDGNCTIGYGHLIHLGKCDGSSSEEEFKEGISENEASKLFDKDVLRFEKVIKNKIKVPLYQNEYDALVSYVYNIGPAFKAPNLIKYLNSKNYALAVNEIETGAQNVKRRKQERAMFSEGVYNSSH